jgi:threonine dehydratase
VIGGQGTLAIELAKQLTDIDYVFVTVSGGGLIAGMATYLSAVSPHTTVIGCLPENSAEMYHSVKAGRFLPMQSKPTLSDGSRGGFEEGSITLPLCQELVKDWTLVSEEEIKDSLNLILSTHHKLVEGSAAVAVASYLKRKAEFVGKNVVIVLCGSNISTVILRSIL